MNRRLPLLLVASVLQLDGAAALAQGNAPAAAQPPSRVGQCALTRITNIASRPGDLQTYVELANGVTGLDFARVPEVFRSRIGDRVRTCLVSVPTQCPGDDRRGSRYRTTNLRTHQSWTLSDSRLDCRGF